jgi:secernin
MCDTLVAVPPHSAGGAVWFAKNSDREPGEAQIVEHLPPKKFKSPDPLRCTYIEIPQSSQINEVLISRPFWMWGAEMGVNNYGLAIGNEAVFTKIPYAKTGLTGMDLLRLALERTSSAREALDLITNLIAKHGQGGGCGYRHRNFRYHNAFIMADPREAWVLETAGPFWAAERVRGFRTISNSLSIGKEFDLVAGDAYDFARSKGWCRSHADFDFARCFGDPFYSALSGGKVRSACTLTLLKKRGQASRDDFFAALTDHAGLAPSRGWRMKMPCAHASWLRTRQAGQTTGSMVSRLHADGSKQWLTGTSSPCLSVFKPVRLGERLLTTGPAPGDGYDQESLFWRHERLHRRVLCDYPRQKVLFDARRQALQKKFDSISAGSDFQDCWNEHLEVIPDWADLLTIKNSSRARLSLFNRYWEKQAKQDKVPPFDLPSIRPR